MKPADVVVSGAHTGGRVGVVRSHLDRGHASYRHVHHWDDEIVIVLTGEIAIHLDGHWIDAGTGTVTLLPRAREHAIVATANDTRILTVLAPAGYEERHALGPHGHPHHDGEPPDLDRLIAAAARCGCELTGPPPVEPTARPSSA